jgi:inner membrane transporter RhtA
MPAGQAGRSGGPLGMLPPSGLVLASILSLQVGAGLAGRLFDQVSPAAVTGLRLWSAAVVMAVFGVRGLRRTIREITRDRAWPDAAVAVTFGVVMGVMNFSIYQSFARIPLGIAVTIEFLGPLAVAVVSSRRAIDLLWVAIAGAGVLLLARGGTSLARHSSAAHGGEHTAVVGVTFALIAAAAWAAYILLSRSTGRRFGDSSGLTIAVVIGALVVTPAGLAAGRGELLRPAVLATGVAIGLLSSVIPYRFELEALRRVTPRVFGIWMSLEPAAAALVGLVLLGEALAVREWAAVGCVIIACAGAARGSPAPDASGGGLPPPPAT